MIPHFSKCNKCNKLIEPQKLQLHIMMCSTAHLRRSKVRFNYVQKKPSQKCMFCHQMIEKEQMDFHLKLGCKHRLVPCIDCDDMFPLSLFTDHLKVCRGLTQLKQAKKQQTKQQQQSSLVDSLMSGINYIGEALYQKGSEAVEFCNKVIEQNRPTALIYLQQFRSRVYDAFQDLFHNMAYDQNVESMPREQIRKIPLNNYKMKNNGQQQQICTICYCQLQDLQVIKQLKCKHFYHPGCIDKWLRINRTCPLCKKDQMQQ